VDYKIMRESTRQNFRALLKEDGYTWDELSDIFVRDCKKADIEEFIYFLEEKNKKRKK
jgi:hypothetical protein